MLEVRYDTITKVLTGWCGDEVQFGNLKKRWGAEEIIILDIPIPTKSLDALLFNNNTLIDNPDYVEPPKPLDLQAEVKALKAKVAKLENKDD